MDKHQLAVMLKYEDKVSFCFCLLIGLSWKRNDLCQEFSVFIVPFVGFFFWDNLTPLLVLGRRVQAEKETTHTMMNDDGKQHREVNNNMKNIGWEKK